MPSSLLSTLYLLTHLVLITVYKIDAIIIPILQKRNKERLSKLPKVIIVVGLGAKI